MINKTNKGLINYSQAEQNDSVIYSKNSDWLSQNAPLDVLSEGEKK